MSDQQVTGTPRGPRWMLGVLWLSCSEAGNQGEGCCLLAGCVVGHPRHPQARVATGWPRAEFEAVRHSGRWVAQCLRADQTEPVFMCHAVRPFMEHGIHNASTAPSRMYPTAATPLPSFPSLLAVILLALVASDLPHSSAIPPHRTTQQVNFGVDSQSTVSEVPLWGSHEPDLYSFYFMKVIYWKGRVGTPPGPPMHSRGLGASSVAPLGALVGTWVRSRAGRNRHANMGCWHCKC